MSPKKEPIVFILATFMSLFYAYAGRGRNALRPEPRVARPAEGEDPATCGDGCRAPAKTG